MNKKNLLKKIGSGLLLLTLVTTLSSCSLIFSILDVLLENNIDDILGSVNNDYASYTQLETP